MDARGKNLLDTLLAVKEHRDAKVAEATKDLNERYDVNVRAVIDAWLHMTVRDFEEFWKRFKEVM